MRRATEPRGLRGVAFALAALGLAAACVDLGGAAGGASVADAGADATDRDAAIATDGSSPDANACGADTTSDPHNCGRCGHDCLGGTCTASRCDAVSLGSVAGTALDGVVVAGAQVFVASAALRASQASGVWRVSTSGGPVESYLPMRFMGEIAVLGDTLYALIYDVPYDGAGQTGGLYACPAIGPAPCAPRLVAAADLPVGIMASGGAIYYSETGHINQRVMRYAPPAAPTVLRPSAPLQLWVDGSSIFGLQTAPAGGPGLPLLAAQVSELAASGADTVLAQYSSPSALGGSLTGTSDALFFTAFNQANADGIVRRVPRTNASLPCDYATGRSARPYGLRVEPTRVYWTSQGAGAAPPYTGGSVASCPVAGCCTAPELLWEGGGQPARITADADALYFVTNATGFILKLAKP
jgi:hypothetical protein